MSESEDAQQRHRQLCSAETFLYYLSAEIERYERYNRIFTTVLIQPPFTDEHSTRLQTARAAANHALEMLRTCDVVAVFERSAFVIALLPETDGAGACTVFDRFDEQMVQAGEGWLLKVAVYPKHSTNVEYFLERFSDLLNTSDPETDPTETWHATSDVSRSWRDLVDETESDPDELAS